MGKEFETFIKIFNFIFEGILEVIYPWESYCIICGEDYCNGLCLRCKNSINKIDYNTGHKINSYGYYGGILKELILKFKYHNDFTAGDILADFLSEYIENNFIYDDFVITYIPMSKKAKKKRGFNQCKYLCKRISMNLNIEYKEVLIKNKENKEQKRLKYNERYDNVKGVFKIKDNISIKKLIVIDDVTTSGATMDEAWKILKKYGASEIKLLTLAKSQI